MVGGLLSQIAPRAGARRVDLVQLDPLDETGYEKDLLRQYGEAVGGRIIAEAPVAGDGPDQPWPAGSHSRWLDGLRIPSEFTDRGRGLPLPGWLPPSDYRGRDRGRGRGD